MLGKFISTTIILISIGISAVGLNLLPEAHHPGILMTSLLLSCLGLSILTYRRLETAQQQNSII